MKAKKTILLLKEHRPASTRYIADIMAEQWTASGHRVICHSGTCKLPDADVIFLHVDKTLVPSAYADCVSKYAVAINSRILDISRRLYSAAQLRKEDHYDGPVIVKTNRNYGGIPECSATSCSPHIARLLSAPVHCRAWRKIPNAWRRITLLNPLKYPIFNNSRDVPSGVWKNSNLLVEKFLPEREGDLFFIRYWTFLGDRNLTGRYGSPHPIVKFDRCTTKITPVDIPDELFAWRKRLKMDYGRFDYVMHEGKPFLLDANKTQAAGTLTKWSRKQFSLLSKGIDFYWT